MLTIALMAFVYIGTATFGLLTLIWGKDDLFNIGLRVWFALLTVLGIYVIVRVLA